MLNKNRIDEFFGDNESSTAVNTTNNAGDTFNDVSFEFIWRYIAFSIFNPFFLKKFFNEDELDEDELLGIYVKEQNDFDDDDFGIKEAHKPSTEPSASEEECQQVKQPSPVPPKQSPTAKSASPPVRRVSNNYQSLIDDEEIENFECDPNFTQEKYEELDYNELINYENDVDESSSKKALVDNKPTVVSQINEIKETPKPEITPTVSETKPVETKPVPSNNSPIKELSEEVKERDSTQEEEEEDDDDETKPKGRSNHWSERGSNKSSHAESESTSLSNLTLADFFHYDFFVKFL